MRKLNRNLPKLEKKNKTNFFSNETARKYMKNIIEKKKQNKKQEQQNPSTKENEYSDAQMNIAISSCQAKLCMALV